VSAIESSGAGLPLANRAVEPTWVRNGSRATQQTYETALAFEATLVQQLSRGLVQASGLGGEASNEARGEGEGEGGSASPFGAPSPQISSLLPQALSEGVMRAGGLGLAAQLTRQQLASEGHARSAGGTAAPNTEGAR
jgi:hypothetical protein